MDIQVYIRDRYSWHPYRRKRDLYINYYRFSNKKRFVRYMEQQFKWHSGHFMLKDDKGKPFARFQIEDGKMIVIYKINKQGNLYRVWRYF